jgi:cell division protein ZapA
MARFEVKIADHSLKLRSSHDVDTVNELVRLVDEKVRATMKLGAQGSLQNAALLAALHLAEELLTLKKKAIKEIDRIEDRAQRLSLDLENSKNQKGAAATEVTDLR